jgi:hypothetical protein
MVNRWGFGKRWTWSIWLSILNFTWTDRWKPHKISNKIAISTSKFEPGTFRIHIYCITISPTCLYLVKRYIVSHHATETIDKGRQCYGPRSITVAPQLIASATTTYELHNNHWLLRWEAEILMVMSIRVQCSGMWHCVVWLLLFPGYLCCIHSIKKHFGRTCDSRNYKLIIT